MRTVACLLHCDDRGVTRRELTKHQRYWLDYLQACEALGQKMSAYAAAQGLGRGRSKMLVYCCNLPGTYANQQNRAVGMRLSAV